MISRKKIHHIYKKKPRHFWLAASGGIVILLITIIFTASVQYYRGKALPGTIFSHFSMGGKDEQVVKNIVFRTYEVYGDENITVKSGDSEMEFTPGQLGVTFDVNGTVDDILEHKLENATNYLAERRVSAKYVVDPDILTSAMSESFGPLEVDSKNASIKLIDGGFQMIPSQEGKKINRSKLVSDLRANLDNLKDEQINLEFIPEYPIVDDQGAEAALAAAKGLIGKELLLSYGFDNWTIKGAALYELADFFPRGQSSYDMVGVEIGRGNKISVLTINDRKAILDINPDEVKVDSLLDSIAQVLDKHASDATLRFEGGKVVEFTSAQDGQTLRKADAKKLIRKKLADVINSNEKVAIDLPVDVVRAKIANEEINALGIRELVGSGVSYFAGSIPNRVHNIELGSNLINGTLVKPGESFSFVSLVGPVSADQGFKQAYVIKSGRTVLDDGGGICQVSTTVFRAALNSGLPIVKRTAHAYRVSYYEQKGFKAGLDATIFSPNVDLQFKNDTANHILVQTTLDRANSRLQVDIYGTKDGRQVEVSEPIVSNIVPAPEPKYEDDPTLPKGVTKQVDYAAAGATSVFTRKVYKDGEIVIDDTFKSVFRPWQAVFLVGTAG